MPFAVYWGKYRRRSTLEELMFYDFGYPWWMLREFDPEDNRVVHIRHLIDVSSKAPIVVPCDGGIYHSTGCKSAPSLLSIAITKEFINVGDAWYVCDDPSCSSAVKLNSFGSCGRFALSFDGLSSFISSHNPPRYVTAEFTRKLARAWGLLDSHGFLRKKAILNFFDYGKAKQRQNSEESLST